MRKFSLSLSNKFDELIVSRKNKMNKNTNKDDASMSLVSLMDSDSSKEIDNDDSSTHEDVAEDAANISEETKSIAKPRHRKNKAKIISKNTEDTSEEENISKRSYKTTEVETTSKGKTKNTRDEDITFKNPISTPRGKKKIPESVNKDRAKLEKEYTREEWLKLSSVELGEAGLAHLAEIERQRYMCGNLFGKVDGIIKDCNAAATNIIEALVEKLETTGDVMHLKTQNLKLREELSEARRKISRQDQEITDLRRSIINLEKEVNALKEG